MEAVAHPPVKSFPPSHKYGKLKGMINNWLYWNFISAIVELMIAVVNKIPTIHGDARK